MDQVDISKVIEALKVKSQQGKIGWQPTAEEETYIAPIKENIFRVFTYPGEYGRIPVLTFINEDGKTIWRMEGDNMYEGDSIASIYFTAQRIADRVDEKLSEVLESLESL